MTRSLSKPSSPKLPANAPAPALEEVVGTTTGGARFDPVKIRRDFPILSRQFNGKPLIYLDNAATTQKPRLVIETVEHYYSSQNSNIHRGVYALSQESTEAHEQARRKVQRFVNAAEAREIIFTRGTTEGINLVASCYGRKFFKAGDEILVSAMEHHSNIVPWQLVAEQTGAVIRVVPFNDRGELMLDEFRKLLSHRTKFVSIVHVSNSLGTINPVKEIIAAAHQHGATVLVDGAQWVAHGRTDVRDLDCDFYAFSGHKLYGPTGIGVLYGKAEVLESMPPYQGGGDMIEKVTFEKTTYAQLPAKFEAGTPHVSGAIGLGAAIDYLESIGVERAAAYEHGLLEYATAKLSQIPGLRLVGTAQNKSSVLSFVIDDPPISAMDLGVKLDNQGIAVRTGHHCCQPVMDRFGIPGTARASLAMYNTREEIDALADALSRIVKEAKDKSAARPATATDGQIRFPQPSAASPQAAADELAEVFDMLEDRELKNQHVLDMGERLPHAFDQIKKLTERVPGCMSEVYLIGRPAPHHPHVLQFTADANADIVRGLIALMQKLWSGQKAKDILAFDIEAFFRRIGLDQFISSQRRNGLAGMVNRIRALANGLIS